MKFTSQRWCIRPLRNEIQLVSAALVGLWPALRAAGGVCREPPGRFPGGMPGRSPGVSGDSSAALRGAAAAARGDSCGRAGSPSPGARPAVPLTPPFGCKGCTATSHPLAAPLLLLSPVSTERAGLLCLRGGGCPPRTPWAWGGCFNFGRTCPPPFPDKLGPAPPGTAFWGWWAPGCLRGCPGKSRGCPTARGGEGAAGGGGRGGRCCQESSSGGSFPAEETGQGGERWGRNSCRDRGGSIWRLVHPVGLLCASLRGKARGGIGQVLV